MRLLLLSIVGGIAITLTTLIVGGLLPYDRAAPIRATFLYWPMFVLPKLGTFDCGNADLIPDKLTCIGIYLAIDALAYSSTVYAILSWRRKGMHSA